MSIRATFAGGAHSDQSEYAISRGALEKLGAAVGAAGEELQFPWRQMSLVRRQGEG